MPSELDTLGILLPVISWILAVAYYIIADY